MFDTYSRSSHKHFIATNFATTIDGLLENEDKQ